MIAPLSPADLIVNSDGSVYHLGLKPHHLPQVLFTVGDPDRVGIVSRHFDTITHEAQNREFCYHLGAADGIAVAVLSTGMGTDNIEIVMNELDALANVDLGTRQALPQHRSLTVVRLGTSGALQPGLQLDSIVLSASGTAFDALASFYPVSGSLHPLAQGLAQATTISCQPYTAVCHPGLAHVFGDLPHVHTLTCPGFYAPQGRRTRLHQGPNTFLDAVQQVNVGGLQFGNFEMETAGYYLLGAAFGHRVLSLNAIVAHRPSGQFSHCAADTVAAMVALAMGRVHALAQC